MTQIPLQVEQQMKPMQRTAFEEIYEEFYAKVYRYVLKRIRRASDAEDLTQEVFIACYRNHEKYDPNISSLSTWIYVITNNRIKNYFRDHQQAYPIADYLDTLSSGHDSLEQCLYLEQLRSELIHAIEILPKRQQQIVLLRYFKSFTTQEIAEALQISPGNVRTLLSRSLKTIRLCVPNLKEF